MSVNESDIIIYEDSQDIALQQVSFNLTNSGIEYFVLPAIAERFIKFWSYTPVEFRNGILTGYEEYSLYDKPNIEFKQMDMRTAPDADVSVKMAYMYNVHLFKAFDTPDNGDLKRNETVSFADELHYFYDSNDIRMSNIKNVQTNQGMFTYKIPDFYERYLKFWTYMPQDILINNAGELNIELPIMIKTQPYYLYEKPTVEYKRGDWQKHTSLGLAYIYSLHLFKPTALENTGIGNNEGGISTVIENPPAIPIHRGGGSPSMHIE